MEERCRDTYYSRGENANSLSNRWISEKVGFLFPGYANSGLLESPSRGVPHVRDRTDAECYRTCSGKLFAENVPDGPA
jgi:hypothetical protein